MGFKRGDIVSAVADSSKFAKQHTYGVVIYVSEYIVHVSWKDFTVGHDGSVNIFLKKKDALEPPFGKTSCWNYSEHHLIHVKNNPQMEFDFT